MAIEKKIYTLKNLVELLNNGVYSIGNLMLQINLHREKSFNINTEFTTMIVNCRDIDRIFRMFGDVEIMYPQFTTYKNEYEDEQYYSPCIKFGIVIE